MRFNFSSLTWRGVARNSSASSNSRDRQAVTACDQAHSPSGHTHLQQNTSNDICVTAVTAVTTQLYLFPDGASGPVVERRITASSAEAKSRGHSGHSGHSLYLCGDSSGHSGTDAGHSGTDAGHSGHKLERTRTRSLQKTVRAVDLRFWVAARCTVTDRGWGGLRRLHRDFCEWCVSRDAGESAIEDFEVALRRAGFLLNEDLGLCSGLILKESDFRASTNW
jgi:hypothetical protein